MKKWLIILPLCFASVSLSSCSQLQEIVNEYESKKAASEAENNQIANADLDNPVASLSVEQLSGEFESNSIVAEDKYMNKPVEVHGVVGSIDDSMFSEDSVGISIRGNGEYSMDSVACSVPRKSPVVYQLKKGDRVAVRGVVTSEEMGVTLSRCKFYDFRNERWIGEQQVTSNQNSSSTNTSNMNQERESYDRAEAASESVREGTCQFNQKSMPCTLISRNKSMSMQWSDGVIENYSITTDNDAVDNRGGVWAIRETNSGFQMRHANGNTISFVES